MTVPDPKVETLSRLLKAVRRDPELTFLLWQEMRHHRYHGPWTPAPEDSQVLTNLSGEEVASIEKTWNCYVWNVIGGAGGEHWTEAEAKEAVEHGLRDEGYFPVPESLWVSPPPRKPLETRVGPWVQEGGEDTWARLYKNGIAAASVRPTNLMSMISWATWEDVANFGAAKVFVEGRCSDIPTGKYFADKDLMRRGLLPADQCVPNPDYVDKCVPDAAP